jgi:cellulose synthase/poly-beta-1,6-N-acetylglucosamine synthase-like glycosyltransferase
MDRIGIVVLGGYFFLLAVLSLYGMHRYYLIGLHRRTRNNRPRPGPVPDPVPRLTVQLPIFNELYVVERLIEAACRIDYPRNRLQIQVLDDSTDATREVARRLVERQRKNGVPIEYLYRAERRGYKAGALQAGLAHATGDLIAIFDADFVPSPEFGRAVLHYFHDPKVGMVQARWGHLNRDYSLLTQVQSILLDGHFVIEHAARNRGGLFFNFNGTAGVWRRSCIESAGGWQHDTLTEDLDLSYRAQMRGWKFLFLSDEVSPAELPVEMAAFKTQQHRWAKGSVQTARKLLPQLLRSGLPVRVKAEAFVHLTSNFAYVLMIFLSLLLYPSILVRGEAGTIGLLLADLPLFLFATFSVLNFYAFSQKQAGPDWVRRLVYLPCLMSVGIGLAVNNSMAVLSGLFGNDLRFQRTPKFRIEKTSDGWLGKRYGGRLNWSTLLELLLAAYFTFALADILRRGLFASVPFLLLFQTGFLYTGLLSLTQWTRKKLAVTPS